MKIKFEHLKNALVSGLRLTGGNETSTFLYSKKAKLYVVFESPLVTYAQRLPMDGDDIPEVCVDAQLLANILGAKTGDVSMTITPNGQIALSNGKAFKANVETIAKNASPETLARVFGKRPADTSLDVSELSSLPAAVKKVFMSVKDNVMNEELSVRLLWTGSQLKILLADSYHGVLLTSEVKKEAKAEIILPLSAFLKAISIADAQTYIEETSFTTSSKTEYLSGSLKATSNAYITFDMMEGLFSEKSLNKADVSKDEFLAAFQSCRALSDAYPLLIKGDEKSVTLTMKTETGSVSETVKVHNAKGKALNLAVHVKNLHDVLSCMGTGIILSAKPSVVYLKSAIGEKTLTQGVCVLHSAGD